jgi:uncharacterized protein YwgA
MRVNNTEMKVKKSDLILYIVKKLNEVGSWTGNTHIQKILYLIQSKTGLKLYDFVIYHYGPYSFDLRDDVDFLAINGRLEREVDEYGYHYRLPSDLKLSLPEEVKEKVDGIIETFGKAPTTLLELITTVDYVVKKSSGKDDGEIVEIVKRIKPHFSERAIELAMKWLRDNFW